MDSTSLLIMEKLRSVSRPAARPVRRDRPRGKGRARARVRRLGRERGAEARMGAKAEALRSESVSSVYFTTGGDVAVNGGDYVGGRRRLSAVARVGVAGGRLPDDSGGYFLSGRQSGCDGFGCNCASGAAVRASSGAQSDDFHEFRWELDYCSAVFARPEY